MLLAKGPSRGSARAQPDDAGDARGQASCRVEELTRIPSDVQDTLITMLSEKILPIPELATEVQATEGLQRHRHRQQPRPRRQRTLQRPPTPLQHRRPARCRPPWKRKWTSSAHACRSMSKAARPARRAARPRRNPPRRHHLPRTPRRGHRGRQSQSQIAQSGTLSTAEAISVMNQRALPGRPLRRRHAHAPTTSPPAWSAPSSRTPSRTPSS